MQDPRYVPPEGIPTMPRRRPPSVAAAGTVLPRDETAPGRARRYVSTALLRLFISPEVVETAVLIVSELVTNAFVHGRQGDVRLRIELTAGVLTLTVADQTPYAPLPTAVLADDDEENGRGLLLVELLSEKWGHRPVGGNPDYGTAVWATLAGATA